MSLCTVDLEKPRALAVSRTVVRYCVMYLASRITRSIISLSMIEIYACIRAIMPVVLIKSRLMKRKGGMPPEKAEEDYFDCT